MVNSYRPPRSNHRLRPSAAVYRRRRIAAGILAAVLILTVVLSAAAMFGGGASDGGSTAPTTAESKATTTTSKLGPATIVAVGDTELGNAPTLPPNPAAILAPVASALKAPIVFANLEGTMTTGSSGKCAPGSTSCYAFSVPPSYAAIMHDAGFNVLNSANNHSHDFGDQGAADTSAALKAAGIEQTGLPGQIAVNDAGGTKVATIGFAPYSNVNNLLDLPTAKALIAKAKTLAPLVVVYMHAGAEGATSTHVTGSEETYVGEDRGNAKAFAHAAIDAGADLVIGSGPHVVRGMEWYQGKLIAYSLGNFANYQNFASSGTMALSAILRVTLDADGTFKSGVLTSVLLSSTGQPAVDSTGQAASLMNQLSTADFGSSAATIQPDGSIAPPATP
jgi:poly-gamma-glutamate capsule biosynthesis protein CapA/YwtB (metallophosphatase superfamily)